MGHLFLMRSVGVVGHLKGQWFMSTKRIAILTNNRMYIDTPYTSIEHRNNLLPLTPVSLVEAIGPGFPL